jgi:hypothetical protein
VRDQHAQLGDLHIDVNYRNNRWEWTAFKLARPARPVALGYSESIYAAKLAAAEALKRDLHAITWEEYEPDQDSPAPPPDDPQE